MGTIFLSGLLRAARVELPYTLEKPDSRGPGMRALMQRPGSPYPDEQRGQTKRRRLLPGKPPAGSESHPVDPRLEGQLAAYQEAIASQLEEGIAAIRESARALMREIAAEMWRTAGGDAGDAQSRILTAVTRDQALRALIAHSDERYQSIGLRVDRLEDSLRTLAESTNSLKEVVVRGTAALQETANSPALKEADEARLRLVEVERHLTAAFRRLEERDRTLIDALKAQIQEQRALIGQETGRIVESGVETMGRLSQRAEDRDQELLEALRARMETERATVEAESARVAESMREPIRDGVEAIDQMAKRMEDQSTHAEARTQELMGRVAERLEQQSTSIETRTEDLIGQLTVRLQDQTSTIETRTEDLIGQLTVRLQDQTSTIETNARELVDHMTDAVEEQVRQLNGSLDAKLSETLSTVGRSTTELRGIVENGTRALEELASAPREDLIEAIREQGRQLGQRMDAGLAQTVADAVQASLQDGVGAFQTLARQVEARESALFQTMREQVQDHQSLLAEETTRIVRSGVDAVGRLAGRAEERERVLIETLRQQIEEQRAAIVEESGRISESVQGYVQSGIATLGQLARRIDEREDELRAAIQEQADTSASSMREETDRISLAIDSSLRNAVSTLGDLAQQTEQRGQALLEALGEQVDEHGALVSRETGRIVEALEGYVKDGVDAMGHLARRVEEQAELSGSRAEEVTARLGETVGDQLAGLHERLQTETRSVSESFSQHETWILRTLDASTDRFEESLETKIESVRDAARETDAELARSFEHRVHALAELVRSDSEALRNEIQASGMAQREDLESSLDERLARVSETVAETSRWAVDEMSRRAAEETASSLGERLDEIVGAIDRNMVRLSEGLDADLDRLGQVVSGKAAQATEAAVDTKFDAALRRMSATIDTVGQMGASVDRIERSVEEATESAVGRALDARLGALAKMIRSDNKVLADRLQSVADQDASKQALRVVKEIQASLPADISDAIEQRIAGLSQQLHRETQATAEAMARANEILGNKLDRVAGELGERSDREAQAVIERLGDAMSSLAGSRRSAPDRIELD